MTKVVNFTGCLFLLFCSLNPVSAFPKYAKAYSALPNALPEAKNDCALCHIRPEGGGERNEFGQAFCKQGFKFTEKLIKKFPQCFQVMKKIELH